jgi:diadenylate cyclase
MPLDWTLKSLTSIAIEVMLLWVAVYGLLRFMRGTRGFGLLRGMTWFGVVSFVVYQVLQATVGTPVLTNILTAIIPSLVLITVILFHPEIRQGLARVGRTGVLGLFNRKRSEDQTLHTVADAAVRMSRERIGALIAFERGVSLAPFRDLAVSVDANVSSILLETIFFPGSPLHDGGVILQNDKVLAAACIFPLTTNPDVQRRMGTRHRAAIGLTDETDAVTLIVSEETGNVSIASAGRLFEAIPHAEIESRLRRLMREHRDPEAEQAASTPAPTAIPDGESAQAPASGESA